MGAIALHSGGGCILDTASCTSGQMQECAGCMRIVPWEEDQMAADVKPRQPFSSALPFDTPSVAAGVSDNQEQDPSAAKPGDSAPTGEADPTKTGTSDVCLDTGCNYAILPDGSLYDGEWSGSLRHGKGKCMSADMSVYDGEWRDDKPHGVGTYTLPNGNHVGAYADGLRHGAGRMHFSDGSVYEGEFKFNNVDGSGTFVFSDGRRYIGQWLDSKMHGQGTHEWPDGSVYDGQYVHDLKDGQGTMSWNDGRRYIGQWNKGKQHGQGVFRGKSGKDRTGEWHEGTRLCWLNTNN